MLELQYRYIIGRNMKYQFSCRMLIHGLTIAIAYVGALKKVHYKYIMNSL